MLIREIDCREIFASFSHLGLHELLSNYGRNRCGQVLLLRPRETFGKCICWSRARSCLSDGLKLSAFSESRLDKKTVLHSRGLDLHVLVRGFLLLRHRVRDRRRHDEEMRNASLLDGLLRVLVLPRATGCRVPSARLVSGEEGRFSESRLKEGSVAKQVERTIVCSFRDLFIKREQFLLEGIQGGRQVMYFMNFLICLSIDVSLI